MKEKIVECVPNFSEGRDKNKIKLITDAIESVSGVTLLDVDPGWDTNRTVVTFVGSPEAVAEGAFQAIKKASEVLDMSTHTGSHPRMGATDVCPFVPVSNITLEECAAIARKVGQRTGSELNIPTYFYEEAALQPERRNLAVVRKGEYEGLEQKLADPNWKPDAGPAKFNAKTGSLIIGAREFLIAYNITLNTRDKSLATDIAFELREKGRVARTATSSPVYGKGDLLFYKEGSFPCGNCDYIASTFEGVVNHCKIDHNYDLKKLLSLNDIDPNKSVVGQKIRRSGKFEHCKGIGWYVEEYKRSQISVNLTNYKVTPPHLVLEEARRLAEKRGVVVTGSEIVGLIPFQALYESGIYYLNLQGKSPYVPVKDVLETAVFSMGLSDINEFDIKQKVIGLPSEESQKLVKMKVIDLVDEISRDTPAPGGGSVAALAGSIGAALSSMVANLTQGKKTTEETEKECLEVAKIAQRLKDDLIIAVDADTDAFNSYMEARRLPAATQKEQTIREAAMLDGLKHAVSVPYNTATLSYEAMQIGLRIALVGNQNSVTDAAVGVSMAFSGVQGGIWNVLINLKDISDKSFVDEMKKKCDELHAKALKVLDDTNAYINKVL